MLGNRIRKNLRRYGKAFGKRGYTAYRLYDWDIPEVRVVVDYYDGHLIVAEYERDQTRTVDDYVGQMAAAAAAALGLAPDRVVTKRRRTRAGDRVRYDRLADQRERMTVREGDLYFFVNLTDYIDTGLFCHHRLTRQLVRAESDGKRFLNLFGYTGAFTVAAAAGGARSTVTVDASGRYLDWARDNLGLNGFAAGSHDMIRAEARDYLDQAATRGQSFDLCVLDPPSFSDFRGQFDIVRDHPELIRQTLAVLAPGGVLWFSTNHAQFEPRLDRLPVAELEELTERTIPEDFHRPPHRVWRMVAR